MQVADLMAMDVITTTPGASLKDVDELFNTHAISGAPVLDDGTLVGVISQSDVVRVLYDQQRAANDVSQYLLSPYPISLPALSEIARERASIADRLLTLTVADAMTGVPVTVGPDDDIAVAARAMCDERVHRVLVTRDGELVGLLSALDMAGIVAADGSLADG